MNLKELKIHFTSSLNDYYPSDEIQSFLTRLTEKYLRMSRLDITLQPGKEINEKEMQVFNNAILRLKNYEPVQYIIGETEFYGTSFLVDKNVLIPRPETEELVDWIVSENMSKKLTILDIGTGSGCIAISLAKQLPKATVSAIDISNEALKIAKQNATKNKVNVNFLKADILQFESNLDFQKYQTSKFDIIVSNPPYVRMLEKKLMQPNVIKHEPNLALFVENEDPLLFYRKIAQLCKLYLKTQGLLYFEINEYLGKEMKRMLNEEGFKHVKLKKDMFGKDRMIKCW